MLQAPTTESPEKSQTSRNVEAPQPRRKLHPATHTGAFGLAAQVRGARLQQKNASLQSAIGNQAALHLMSRPQPSLQTKLSVNEPGDRYEHEADRVADRVMRMPDSATAVVARSSARPALQRKCACEGSGHMCSARNEEEERGNKLHRKAEFAPAGAVPAEAPPIVHDVLNSPGQPLDASTRAFFEPRFGYDFSHVRVHAGSRAAESARAVGALAYTVNHAVAFGSGGYTPHTVEGRRLLAHELAHVVQQSDGPLADAHIVQRFSTSEHTEIGNTAYEKVKREFSGPAYQSSNLYRMLQGGADLQVGSNTLQYGDIVADADFFLTFEDLIHESGKIPGILGKAALDARNFRHFTPDNIRAWIPQHDAAVVEMVTAYKLLKGVKDWLASIEPLKSRARAAIDKDDYARANTLLDRYQARFNAEKAHKEAEIQNAHALAGKALARNAFAEHFLTDAFSAGHVVTPRREILEEAGVRLDQLPSDASLVRTVILGTTWGELGEVRAHARSLAWHDLDNFFGVEVKNNKPGAKPWIACGDNCSNDKLASHSHWAATHDAVVEGTEESIRDLWRAGLAGVHPPNYRSVLDLVPRPTFKDYPVWGADQWQKQLEFIRGDKSSGPAPGSQMGPLAVELHPIEYCRQPDIGCYDPFVLTDKDWIRQYSFAKWVRPWITRIQATAATRYNF